MRLRMSSAKYRSFCLDLNVLTGVTVYANDSHIINFCLQVIVFQR